MKVYITFGSGQAHHIAGKLLHPNVVAVIEVGSTVDVREEVRRTFDNKFHNIYLEEDWKEEEQLAYYPDGYVYL